MTKTLTDGSIADQKYGWKMYQDCAQTKHPETYRPEGQNVRRQNVRRQNSRRHNILGTKRPEGQNVRRDKTSDGDKTSGDIHLKNVCKKNVRRQNILLAYFR
jgi:hypothetical protein